MTKRRDSPEEIISKLREAEVLLNRDKTVVEAVRVLRSARTSSSVRLWVLKQPDI